MKKREWTLALYTFFLIGIMASMTEVSHAQFKKYKSKTQFESNQDGPTGSTGNANPTLLPPPPAPNKKDFFGRSGSTNSYREKKDSKYVNLNYETAFGPEVITSFDFPNADIMEITKHMQKLTGINLILDKNVKGKISILAPSPITVGDAWKAYLTALNLNGLTLVKSGSFYKVIQVKDVRYNPTRIYTGAYTPETDTYVMRVIPLRYINAKEIDRSFRPFMSRYGRMIHIQQTNTIIIHDTGSNINRLVKLIEFLDVPGHDESLQVIPVKHSSAQEISKLLQDILKTGKSSSRFRKNSNSNNIEKIIAEPRTNSIIAMANAEGARELRELVKKLDVKISASAGDKIHVYYLLYGDAKNISGTLNKIVSGTGKTTTKSRFSKNGQESSDLFSNDVKVEPDEDNNALVVTASPTDWLTVKSVIKKLDIPKDQVYVEGLIMETSVTKGDAFGISVLGAHGSGRADRVAIGDPGGLINLFGNNITSVGGLFTGFGLGRKVTLNIGGEDITVKGINGLITAIAENSNANVLATPQILALDNKEALFEVGETVPIREQNTTANGTTSTTTSQQKVALKVKIKPHINKVTRFIRLEIDQNISEFAESTVNNDGLGARTQNRLATTEVVVRDRDTIAMGGLMRDRHVTNVSKVPLLGDIPVLGWLFKSQRKSLTKVNLLMFLTPKILATYEKTAAKNLKDVLNRRSAHLKNIYADGDPFGATTKGLYKKALKQDQGPLYDRDASFQYIQSNEDNEGLGKKSGTTPPPTESYLQDIETPDYSEIVKQIEDDKRAKNEPIPTEEISTEPAPPSLDSTVPVPPVEAAPAAPTLLPPPPGEDQ